MATENNPEASYQDFCAGDNGSLLAGYTMYVNQRTGETVTLDEPLPFYLTRSQLQSLPIDPSTFHIAGWSGQWLIHYPMPVHSDAAAHTLNATVLGHAVEVRVTPVNFEWDYGQDIPPIITSDGGEPFPNQTVEAGWATPGQGNTVTLTIDWRGEFRLAGMSAWLPVNGLATTTQVSDPIEVIEAPARLVASP